MKQRIYGIAELKWVSEEDGFCPSPIKSRWFCSPSEFECDKERLWSICAYLESPVNPNETTITPVTTLVDEAATQLLFVGSRFRITLNGTDTLALGYITQIDYVDEEEHWRRAQPQSRPD